MKFSIITISFNSGKTIERTLCSILNQTYYDYEYIIVDGGSKDETLDIIKRYEPMFEGRLKWKSEPDKGIYDAMNKGIMRSSGDIIGIVNSDDWLEPDALALVNSKYMDVGKREDCLYTGGIIFHNQDGITKNLDVNLNTFYKQAPLYIMAGVRHPATFVPKKVYNKIGLYNDKMRLSADQDFILRCYFSRIEFVPIDKMLSNMSSGGISTIGNKKARQCSRNDRKLMLKNFGKTGFVYYWLYYSWRIRGAIRRLSIRFGLYK